MAVSIAAFPQFLDSNGKPLSGGLVWTYAAGTTTPLTTYTSREGDIANSNPIVLDADGRGSIWLSTNVAYKLVLENAPIFPAAHGEVQDTVDDYYAGADPDQLQVAGVVPATGGTYTGLVNFNAGALFNGSAAQNESTLNSLGISSAQVHNLWMNSDFSINRRNLSSVSDGSYGPDRTVVLCETGSVGISIIQQPTDGIPYAMRMTQPDATPKRIGAAQIVEARNCLAYRGKNLVFVPKVRASVGTTIRAALVAWVGAANAPTRDVVNSWASGTYTAGNFFVANTLSIAVGAVSVSANTWTDIPVSSSSAGGVSVPSNMNNLYMLFWTESQVSQNVTLDASIMRCGLGTSSPLWTPPDAQVETERCKRYYQESIASARGTVANAGGFIDVPISWVEMLSPPSVNGQNGPGFAAANVTNDVLVGVTVFGARYSLTVGAANVDSFVVNRLFLLTSELGV